MNVSALMINSLNLPLTNVKILQLGKAYPPVNLGGVETTIQLINEGLHKNNVYSDVLGVNDKFSSENQMLELGNIYRSGLLFKAFSTLFSISLIIDLWRLHKKYDIIHIHHPDPMSAFALWVINPPCKIIVHWHSDILRQKYLLKLFFPIQGWLLNKADLIITTSFNYANSSFHLRPYFSKIKVLPIGIDTGKLGIDKKVVDTIRNTYKDKKLILAIGRMSYYKGYEYLVDSISFLNKNCRIVVIGGGNLINKLTERIPPKFRNKIEFLGRVSDLERNCYIAACDVFVLSSILKTEAYAIVQVEAMAFGRPIVSTEIPGSGVQEVNLNKISGFTVPIQNSKAIAQSVNSIIENAVLYDKLSKGAYNRFKTEFTQEIMVKRLITLYFNLLIK
jgi:glycosyltransferase involved in cell wall biosynthesis